MSEQQEVTTIHDIPETDLIDLNSTSSESEYEDDDVSDDPQVILDKAGCTTQLSNLQLSPEGDIPLELLTECVQCLLYDKYWPALILCKAMSLLKPGNQLSNHLLEAITAKIDIDSKQCDDDSETCESESESESESETSNSSIEDTESSDSTESETEMPPNENIHSCPACTH
ncbi:hypothetical protein LOD99_6993 [Oopsacas minuta]|uniref:Uncharacterized protein n=1 Tax=Oopsacas minuta TaxID=111878 RepID=A0AAV7JKP6_9METZ|nr:hypothetical protein LOD99_6993 [Oopsacas minuta]